MMRPSIPLTIGFAIVSCAYVDAFPRSLPSNNPPAENSVSACEILDKAVQAIGGDAILASIKGITYRAPK